MTREEGLALVKGQPIGTILVFEVSYPVIKTRDNAWGPLHVHWSGGSFGDGEVARAISDGDMKTNGRWAFM